MNPGIGNSMASHGPREYQLGAVSVSTIKLAVFAFGFAIALASNGCRSPGPDGRSERSRHRRPSPTIRRVACVYDQRPWLNLDKGGDLDYECIWFRAFLDPGNQIGVLAEGTFHIEMYRIDRTEDGKEQRTLVSDWHYPTSAVNTIAKPGRLGEGYVLQLRWATKDVAGREIDLVTRFEDPFGNIARSGTRRMRVPKLTR